MSLVTESMVIHGDAAVAAAVAVVATSTQNGDDGDMCMKGTS
jgi:hypothetical protein